MTYQLYGKTLQPGRPFETSDGTQYPGDWLANATPVELAHVGIEWVDPEPVVYYDQRFFWGPNNPKDLDQLKTAWVGKQKQTAGTLLAPTDWYVIRMQEDPACMCPPPVKAYRAAVRSVSDLRETAINACLTAEELQSLITTNELEAWPDDIPS